jgi:hypothetical protein
VSDRDIAQRSARQARIESHTTMRLTTTDA